jgi:xylulokinase
LMRVDPTAPLALVGGGARSRWWSQLLADVLQTPLVLGAGGEAGGALGAARLGWLCDGGRVEEVCIQPPARDRFEPDTAAAPLHDPRFARFQSLYGALRPVFAAS